jgi:Transposase zinc-binding domain
VSLDQLKVMAAIERCRTVAPGGHVARCEDCSYSTIAYNSCRNLTPLHYQIRNQRGWLRFQTGPHPDPTTGRDLISC